MPDTGHTPPHSARYDDTYYSGEDGWAECAHVFLDGNRLAERFAALNEGAVFVVGELGYGTGLNVAAAMTAFAARGHGRGRLAVFTVEGHPLDRAAFAAHAASASARWPEAGAALTALSDAYPEPRDGFVQTRPAPDVTLTIGFGEAADVLARARCRADAWFLDGFSPARNPGMWTAEVLGAVARLSKPDATAATFTVAGAVRRGLAEAGFAVAKAPGFGRKREMLTATLERRPPARAASRDAAPDAPPGGPVAVMGAGIAGAATAWHLARLGQRVTVFDPGGPGAGASGNPGGLVTPRVEAADTPIARFYRDAYAYALGFYAEAAPSAFAWAGATVRMEAGRAGKVLASGLWAGSELEARPDGLFAPDAGVLRPADAVAALLGDAPVRDAGTMTREGDGWRVDGAAFASVVVAAPVLAASLDLGVPAPLSGHRGQIDVFGGRADGIVTGDGYVAPLGGGAMAGATYAPAPLDAVPAPDPADTAANAATAARLTGRSAGQAVASRAAVRAATPDRHPLAGPVPDIPAMRRSHAPLRHGAAPTAAPAHVPGLFVLTGLGSRGLVTAPLLGAHAAALIAGAPSPLPTDAADALHPARFFSRALRRKRA